MQNEEKKNAEGAATPTAAEQVQQQQDTKNEATTQDVPEAGVEAVSLSDFLKTIIKPREDLLTPIIQAQSINMLYAWRGVGKTHTAIHMACAMASGGNFHTWKAPKPIKVLYLDGEMPATEMQKRFKDVLATGAYAGAESNITIVTPDMNFPKGMPNLATPEGQQRLMPLLGEIDVVIVDNISTLASWGKENEAESWIPLQAWALKVRAMGKAVLFIHHANKDGGQRGTSKKEDIMDTVIKLSRPADYDPAQGARFQVTFDKARNIMGDDTEGFEAHFTKNGWVFKSLADVRLQQVHELKALDPKISVREIAEALDISKSTVHRLLKQPLPTT